MLYFAYGSNLDESLMKLRCKESKVLSTAWIEGYCLSFTRYSSGWDCGVADVVLCEGKEVWGLLYQITDSDLKELDKFEGYPDAYTRFQTDARTENKIYKGAYVYTVRLKSDFILPSSAYFNIIKRAATKHAFPEQYLESLNKKINLAI